ncbi:MAG: helix-turn-helix transcriptional regulator [Spirochaetaceae bacterium]
MNSAEITRFIINSVAIFSGIFALGGVTILYKQYKTRILKLIIIFLLSIVLISNRFWLDSIFSKEFIISGIASFLGCAMCIIILPYLTTSLLSIKLSLMKLRILWVWNLLYIGLALSYYLLPEQALLLNITSLMLLLSILFWVIFLIINSKNINDRRLKKSLNGFALLSFIFLIFLTLDMLITLLPIEVLSIIDNFSIMFYFCGINTGIFFFADDFLSREAYIEKGKLSSSFLENFKLTLREGEIIEKVYSGSTNKEVGEQLYISSKTVENHLTNIYQKLQIKSRTKLIIELNTWQKL